MEIADNKSDSTLDGRVKLRVNDDYNDYLGCTVKGYAREEFGKTVYDVSAAEFAAEVPELIRKGVRIAGGCCGTTPEYISALILSL